LRPAMHEKPRWRCETSRQLVTLGTDVVCFVFVCVCLCLCVFWSCCSLIHASNSRGAVLLCVARGKVSEGIDFGHHHGYDREGGWMLIITKCVLWNPRADVVLWSSGCRFSTRRPPRFCSVSREWMLLLHCPSIECFGGFAHF
jgi:hypothetical protein